MTITALLLSDRHPLRRRRAQGLVGPHLREQGLQAARSSSPTGRSRALPVLAEFKTDLAGLDVGGLRRRLRQSDRAAR